MVDREALLVEVRKASPDKFFDALEKVIGFQIPQIIQNILRINCYDSAMAMSKFDQLSIDEMEDFMANDFKNVELPSTEKASYLGVYTKNPEKFKFLSGQKRLLQCLIDKCKILNEPSGPNDSQTSSEYTSTSQRNIGRLFQMFSKSSRDSSK